MISCFSLCKIQKSIVLIITIVLYIINPSNTLALVYPEIEFKIFQFPPNMIPRIDGNPEDWDIVPEDYFYGTDLLLDVEPEDPDDSSTARNTPVNPDNIDVKVCVGWVKGINKLYVLYEAYDNYWDFGLPGTHNDMFEFVVDADLSGGDFIFVNYDEETYTHSPAQKGSHAQNYHICTPAVDKSRAIVWNCPSWLNKLPYMNCVYSFDFEHGESGNLVMEFWITPFDYISFDGPGYSTVSELKENTVIGISWLIADWDGDENLSAFPSLSNDVMMVHDASYLRAFRLMPLEEKFLEPIDAYFTFTIIDNNTRKVTFKDLSHGEITSWKWDFNDGATSTEQNPVHTFEKRGYLGTESVDLFIEGPKGKSRYSALMEIIFK